MPRTRNIDWYWWGYFQLPTYAHRTDEYVIVLRVNGRQWRDVLVRQDTPPSADIIPAIASLFEAGLLPNKDPQIDRNEAFYGPIRRH